MEEPSDESQFRELLRLKYPGRDISSLISLIERSQLRAQTNRKKAEEHYWLLRNSRTPWDGSILKVILDPDDKELGEVPIYQRYLAYMIIELGYKETSRRLHMSRTSLWRFIHSLGSRGRAPSLDKK